MNFKNNILPSKSGVSGFNIASKLSGGTHTVAGLLPSILSMVENTREFRGIKAFFAKVTPDIFVYGGGLKNQGIPPAIQAAGIDSVSDFLKDIADKTGFNHDFLLSLYKSKEEKEKQMLDDVLFLNANRILKSTNARALNVYAAADMMPAMFSVGSLPELYGETFYNPGPGNQINKDIYFYMPGHIAELLDPTTGKIIPRTKLNYPGILIIWNPYNLSHLQVPQTEDLMQWTKIPETAPVNPPYLNGIGLQFVSRIKGAVGQGVC